MLLDVKNCEFAHKENKFRDFPGKHFEIHFDRAGFDYFASSGDFDDFFCPLGRHSVDRLVEEGEEALLVAWKIDLNIGS